MGERIANPSTEFKILKISMFSNITLWRMAGWERTASRGDRSNVKQFLTFVDFGSQRV